MIDKQKIELARKSNLIEYLKNRGYGLKKTGKNEFRLEEHDSLVISNNLWHWFSRDVGGNTLDFLIKYENVAFVDAVTTLTGEYIKENFAQKKSNVNPDNLKKSNNLILPEKNIDYKRIYAYLKQTRKIDRKIILEQISNKSIYESTRHNCVFTGRNTHGEICFACERGTLSNVSFKMDCAGSDKRYSFFMEGENNRIYVFEAPIDALSHATIFKMQNIDYKKDHRISLCSLSHKPLFQYLEDRPQITKVVLCLDNDKFGIEASKSIMEDLKNRGFEVEIVLPTLKDYNEDLIAIRKIDSYKSDLEI